MVIVRVYGGETFFLERVVFPFEIMSFHCPRSGEVEVIMRTTAGSEERQWVAAEQLLADDAGGDASEEWRPSRGLRPVRVRANASTICRVAP